MSELQSSTVHRHLDRSLKVMGFEAIDLILTLLFASIMNFIFGQTFLALWLVFIFPITILFGLYFIKRKHPPHYLGDLIKYFLMPGFYFAGVEDENESTRKRSLYV